VNSHKLQFVRHDLTNWITGILRHCLSLSFLRADIVCIIHYLQFKSAMM